LASYTIGILVTTGSLKSWNIGGALKATFWGAVSGGLGELFSAGSVVKALGDAKFLVQAAAHGCLRGYYLYYKVETLCRALLVVL
jgi:hypothetical protein